MIDVEVADATSEVAPRHDVSSLDSPGLESDGAVEVVPEVPFCQYEGLAIDLECDGTGDQCVYFEYDSNGIGVKRSKDDDCDGLDPLACEEWAYTPDGNLEAHALDSDCDGNLEKCTTYERDEDGLLTAVIEDYDCDQVPNVCNQYVLLSEGEEYVMEQAVDTGCDGSVEYCKVHYFDGDFDRVYMEIENPCDVTVTSCTAWTYDGLGNLLTVVEDLGCDDVPESCEESVYNDQGFKIEMTQGDCLTNEYCWVYQLDDQGYPATSEIDEDCDGSIDICMVAEDLVCF